MRKIKVIKKGTNTSVESIQDKEAPQEELQDKPETKVFEDRLSKLLKAGENKHESGKIIELIWRSGIDARFDTLMAFKGVV